MDHQPSLAVAPLSRRHQAGVVAAILCFWPALCGLVAGNSYLRRHPESTRTYGWYIVDQMGFYMPFLLVTLFVFFLALAQQRRGDSLKKMVLTNIAASFVWMAIYSVYAIWWILWHRGVEMAQFKTYFTQLHGINSLFDYSIYWFIVTAVYAGVLYRESRLRTQQAGAFALRTAQLEGMLIKSQLETLKAQLQPHFLFNTLNSISSCFRTGENELGLSLLVKLSDLLRHSLNQGARRSHSLRAELAFIDLYLDIEAVRFEDRLSIERHFEPNTLSVSVPVMILQPLVENAIRHGVSQSLGPALLRLVSNREGDYLMVAVFNDGPLLAETDLGTGGEGIGLRNTLERLEHEYGAEARLELQNWETRGVTATLTIPWMEAEEQTHG